MATTRKRKKPAPVQESNSLRGEAICGQSGDPGDPGDPTVTLWCWSGSPL
jgi:hypothetical protein